MIIQRIYNNENSYEVRKDGVKKIELTEYGNDKTTIYLVTYKDESVLYVGLLEHEVEYA